MCGNITMESGVQRQISNEAGRSEDIEGDYEEKIAGENSVMAGYDQ